MANFLRWLCGTATPRSVATSYRRRFNIEKQSIDRQILKLDREIANAKVDAKKTAKQCGSEAARPLALEIALTVRQRNQLAHVSASIQLIAAEMVASASIGAAFNISAGMMAHMNRVYTLERTRTLMTSMAREFHRHDLIDEAIAERFEAQNEEEDDGDDASVDAIMEELLNAAPAPKGEPKAAPKSEPKAAPKTEPKAADPVESPKRPVRTAVAIAVEGNERKSLLSAFAAVELDEL
jgi:hypothetical protein